MAGKKPVRHANELVRLDGKPTRSRETYGPRTHKDRRVAEKDRRDPRRPDRRRGSFEAQRYGREWGPKYLGDAWSPGKRKFGRDKKKSNLKVTGTTTTRIGTKEYVHNDVTIKTTRRRRDRRKSQKKKSTKKK